MSQKCTVVSLFTVLTQKPNPLQSDALYMMQSNTAIRHIRYHQAKSVSVWLSGNTLVSINAVRLLDAGPGWCLDG